MTQPQAIVTPLTQSAIFLTILAPAGTEADVRAALSDLGGLRRSVGFRAPEGRLTCVAGIGADLWDRLVQKPRPAGLHPFRELTGPAHRAPSTPGDLLLHIKADRLDLCFELATLVLDRLGAGVHVVDEVHGFRSFDQRDLLGFVDGTENPEGDDALTAALIGDEDPAWAGGSYVVVQKYLHDMAGWNALPVEQQELAVGRTKLHDIELPDDVKPPTSHVALNTIVDADGTEHDILRENMPFGRVGSAEFGTYFIGYVARPAILEKMLERMFVGDEHGHTDRILDFSTAVTGSLFFVPTSDFLDDLA